MMRQEDHRPVLPRPVRPMATIAVILLFLLGSATPTAMAVAVGHPAGTAPTHTSAPPTVTAQCFTNGNLPEREERCRLEGRGARTAYALSRHPNRPSPDHRTNGPVSTGTAARPLPAGSAGAAHTIPPELLVLHCVFRC